MSSQQLRAEDDVAGLVDSVDVAEGGGDGEHRADGAQGLVDLPDLVVQSGFSSKHAKKTPEERMVPPKFLTKAQKCICIKNISIGTLAATWKSWQSQIQGLPRKEKNPKFDK